MSRLLRSATLLTAIAISASAQGAGLPGDLSAGPDSPPDLTTPPVARSVDGADDPWTQISGWATEAVVPWNGDVVVSFENGRGLWLYDEGDWTALTSQSPDSILVACDRLFTSFPEGGGLWSYEPVGGWENLSPAAPVQMIDAGTRVLVDFDEHGLWEYGCSASSLVSLGVDGVDAPIVSGAVQSTGACLRTIRDWSAVLRNVPLEPAAGTSPFNDIVLERVLIDYDPAPSGISSQIVELGGVTIGADSTGVVSFAPITQEALTGLPIDTSVQIDATLVFEGRTPGGAPVRSGAVTEGLMVEKCQGVE